MIQLLNASSFPVRKNVLINGAKIHLESQHGGNVRVTSDNEVDGNGKSTLHNTLLAKSWRTVTL